MDLELFITFSLVVLTVLVRWFRLHSLASGVRPLFGAYPKIGAANFGCLSIVVAGLQLLSFHRRVWCPIFTLLRLAAN